jgi:hypothetical protein
MIKLDLTIETTAVVGQIIPGQQNMTQSVKKVKLANFLSQALRNLNTFSEVEANRELIKNASVDSKFSVTDIDFETVFKIFKKTPTSTKLVFMDMIKECNPEFDLIEYEKNCKV